MHGGGHAKWSFEQYAQVLSEEVTRFTRSTGWVTAILARLPEEQFLGRGIDDVAREELC